MVYPALLHLRWLVDGFRVRRVRIGESFLISFPTVSSPFTLFRLVFADKGRCGEFEAHRGQRPQGSARGGAPVSGPALYTFRV